MSKIIDDLYLIAHLVAVARAEATDHKEMTPMETIQRECPNCQHGLPLSDIEGVVYAGWSTEMRVRYAETVLSKSVLPLLHKELTPARRKQIRELVADAAITLGNALHEGVGS